MNDNTLPYNEPILLNNSNNCASVNIPLDYRSKEIARGFIPQNEHKAYTVRLLEYPDNGKYLDIRECTKVGKEGQFHPSKRGIQIKASIFKEYMISVLNNSLKYC